MRFPAPDTRPSRAEAEALALLSTLGELSVAATAAANAADGESLLRILGERARIIERADALIAQVMAESASSPGEPVAHGPASLIAAARDLAKLDATLRAATAAQRDALGRDLDALENGGAARSAYGGRQRGRDTIDVMR